MDVLGRIHENSEISAGQLLFDFFCNVVMTFDGFFNLKGGEYEGAPKYSNSLGFGENGRQSIEIPWISTKMDVKVLKFPRFREKWTPKY